MEPGPEAVAVPNPLSLGQDSEFPLNPEGTAHPKREVRHLTWGQDGEQPGGEGVVTAQRKGQQASLPEDSGRGDDILTGNGRQT